MLHHEKLPEQVGFNCFFLPPSLSQFARPASSCSSFGKCPVVFGRETCRAAISKHHKTKPRSIVFFFALWEQPEPFSVRKTHVGPQKVPGSCARNWRSEGEDLMTGSTWIQISGVKNSQLAFKKPIKKPKLDTL